MQTVSRKYKSIQQNGKQKQYIIIVKETLGFPRILKTTKQKPHLLILKGKNSFEISFGKQIYCTKLDLMK